jgi:hypothetical protein
MFFIFVIFITMFFVVMGVGTKLEGVNRGHRLKDRHPVGLSRLDDVDESLLETTTVCNNKIGLAELRNLLG